MTFWTLVALAVVLGFVLGRYLLPPRLCGLVRDTQDAGTWPDPGAGWSDARGEYEVSTGTLWFRPSATGTWRPVAELPVLLADGGYLERFRKMARRS